MKKFHSENINWKLKCYPNHEKEKWNKASNQISKNEKLQLIEKMNI